MLWYAVRAVHELRSGLPCAVFTGDTDALPDSFAACALHLLLHRALATALVSCALATSLPLTSALLLS